LTAHVREGNFSSLIEERLASIADPEEKEVAQVRMDLFKENWGLEQFLASPLGPGSADWRDFITSVTGYRMIFGGLEMHNGLDLGLPEGTPVYAAGSGEVTGAGYNDSSGNYIELAVKDSGSDTVFVTYMHLGLIEASKGEVVAEGQRIGLSGNTGRSVGPHLHIQVSKNGEILNPLFLIRLPETGAGG
jgi:murein DD-endopeptidase MepM/ murein hydrolase activator NlpD